MMQLKPHVVDAGTLPAVAAKGRLSWQERREALRARLEQQPLAAIGADEVMAHLDGMPAHYWEHVTEGDLVWGLEIIHGFLSLLATPKVEATKPFVDWHQLPESNRTHVMLCTWDRHGLLAKAAAAFSAVRLNILQADVFTRADSVVLDLFHITGSDGRSTATAEQLEQMTSLLDGALSEPPRFASFWACSRHKYLAEPSLSPPRIMFDNRTSAVHTLVQVEATDRLGLLYDILQTLADSGLDITQAQIHTDGDVARDIIHVKDAHGKKVLDPRQLEALRRQLDSSLTCLNQD
jgi:[protein-PII] uridylyltransferase